MAKVNTRPYKSQRRREHAQETRARILESARRLFLKTGYGSTTIGAIAADAGVAAQTVYAGFGSKRGIIFALLDEMAADADITSLLAAVEAASGDPARQLCERIVFNTRFFEGAIDLVDLIRTFPASSNRASFPA